MNTNIEEIDLKATMKTQPSKPIPFDEAAGNQLVRFLGEQPYAKVAPLIDVMSQFIRDYMHNYQIAIACIEEKEGE